MNYISKSNDYENVRPNGFSRIVLKINLRGPEERQISQNVDN